MPENQLDQETLLREHAAMKKALLEILDVIKPYIEPSPPQPGKTPPTFDRQAVHDVRNLVNELGLLRALGLGDEKQ